MGKDWKDELQDYKDFKHGKVDESDFEDQPYHKAKRRNTCRGGKPHKYVPGKRLLWYGWTVPVCERCGKRNWRAL